LVMLECLMDGLYDVDVDTYNENFVVTE
jgi:hypothetical protein